MYCLRARGYTFNTEYEETAFSRHIIKFLRLPLYTDNLSISGKLEIHSERTANIFDPILSVTVS